jgi:hypothetical protein
MELSWNAGFFGEGGKGSDSPYSTYQRSGHLGFREVLKSPYVDFFVSPYSYAFRGKGGSGAGMLLTESVRIHNKIYIYEDDSRTHLKSSHPLHGRAMNLDESVVFLKRNFVYNITRGHGIWWLINDGHISLNDEPEFQSLLKSFKDIGTFAMATDRSPGAEIAILLDDESFYYETVRNDLDIPLIFKQRHLGLAHMGAPYDLYLLDDFLENKLPPYKLYIFLNPVRLNETQREDLEKQIRQKGRTALWIYSPGYIKDKPSIGNMTDIAGFEFGSNEHPWASFMHITNFNHSLTEGLSQDLYWGTDSRLAPMFYIDDPEAIILGEAIFAQGTCKPGFGLKEFDDWNSIYISVPNIPAQVLRNIARYAGVNIYDDHGDVVYRSKELFGVHSVSGGERTFQLPETVEVVYDLFREEVIGRNTKIITVTLPTLSTNLYYIGSEDKLKLLEVK